MEDTNPLAEKIFSLLKGNGLKIKIFDGSGAETTDPESGRRFFIIDPNLMVTIDDDSKNVEFNMSSASKDDDTIRQLRNNIKREAEKHTTPFNFTTKIFGKSIQPRDYAYQAKAKKDAPMMENASINSQLRGQILHFLKKTGLGATAAALTRELKGAYNADVVTVLNHLARSGEVSVSGTDASTGKPIYSLPVEETVMEGPHTQHGMPAKKPSLGQKIKGVVKKVADVVAPSDEKLVRDLEKDTDGKRPLTKKDAELKESFSKMFGSLKTSQQTLENVRILVKHKVPVNEEIRGARSRHIAAIFLECNGERFRFPHNYLPGARAMAQHMAHGGTMVDKVGSYIAESTGQLLKLQSFNRYVTTNKLINEDSSGIVETVKENIETIRTELKKLTGVKTYETVKARLETFERKQLDEDDTSQLKELFTIRRFDEKFEEVLPIVKQLVQEKDTFHKRIEEAAANVITLRRESINTTPVFEFASENARLGYKISELALRIVENDELSGFIGKIGSKLVKEGTVNDFEKAILSQVFENIVLEEKKKTLQKELKESVDLENYFNRFDRTFI